MMPLALAARPKRSALPAALEQLPPFLAPLIMLQDAARAFMFVSDAPTTTTQRLKALATGGLPSFFDISNSFTAGAVSDDNLMDQLAAAGKHMVGGARFNGVVPMGQDVQGAAGHCSASCTSRLLSLHPPTPLGAPPRPSWVTPPGGSSSPASGPGPARTPGAPASCGSVAVAGWRGGGGSGAGSAATVPAAQLQPLQQPCSHPQRFCYPRGPCSFNVKDLHTVDDGVWEHLLPALRAPNGSSDGAAAACADAAAAASLCRCCQPLPLLPPVVLATH